MITISDVAAKAGVSRATVSYVLNSRSTSVRISESTRQRVLKSAEELGYHRNELARAMITGKNRMLGFWVMHSHREPIVRTLTGAMKEADAHDYFIKMIGFDQGMFDKRALERCIEGRLSGILAIHAPASTLDTLYPKIQATGIPCISVDSRQAPPGCTNIAANGRLGMEMATEHLVQLGHRKIAFIGNESSPGDSFSQLREGGYRAVMERHDLARYYQVEYSNWNEEPIVEAALKLLTNPQTRPTAIACGSDHTAMIVIRTAAELGLKVPDDLSVTGFDNVATAAFYNPPLTTVAQSFEEMGSRAVKLLLQMVALPEDTALQSDPDDNILPVQLIVRNSTAPPRRAP
jgi:LacI family transcriptional regulator